MSAEGDWRQVDALRFDAVASLAAGGAGADYVTGSVKAELQGTLENVELAPDKVLMLRWRPDGVSNGEALGVDDVVLTCDAVRLGTMLRIAGKNR